MPHFQKKIPGNIIEKSKYEKYSIKRGLRNDDGTGVLAGLTNVCNVHGYIISESEKNPIEGELIYRGVNIKDIVDAADEENRVFYEECIYLLLVGELPTKKELEGFKDFIDDNCDLPDEYIENILMKNPSPNLMNKIASSILSLYAYDDDPENNSLEHMMRQCGELISKMPSIVVNAYRSKKNLPYCKPIKGLSIAENFLYMLKGKDNYTGLEVKILDKCMAVHAEHGGGNNSTFTTRVLSSTGTDTYGAIAGSVSSLKGPKHGGACNKVVLMFEDMMSNIKDLKNDNEIKDYIIKLLNKEAFDRSGLVYGMGHAVYTLSDPRAIILKNAARELAKEKGKLDEFEFMTKVESLTPDIFYEHKNVDKTICANVDFYSGFVYKMLGIDKELFLPLFALSRLPGWCAHRMEEVIFGKRIVRPAYKSVKKKKEYIPINNR